MKQVLSVLIFLLVSSSVTLSAFAQSSSDACPLTLKANVLVNRNESTALSVQDIGNQRVVYRYCSVTKMAPGEVLVNNCLFIGSAMGYTAHELMTLDKYLTQRKWLQRAGKTGLMVGSLLLGTVGGGLIGTHLPGAAGGHGMAALAYLFMGAGVGTVAGPTCGGLYLYLSSAQRNDYKALGKALNEATRTNGSSSVLLTDASIPQVAADLAKALKFVK